MAHLTPYARRCWAICLPPKPAPRSWRNWPTLKRSARDSPAGWRSRLARHTRPAVPPSRLPSCRWSPLARSTGGPQALRAILSQWPKEFPAGVLIAQHISAAFAPSLAVWLADGCRLTVRLASECDRPQAGVVLLAATDDHLVLRHDGTLGYTPEPRDNPFRPSVDVLFDSLARHWRRPSVAVLLTGIGRDGAKGLLELRRAGWHTVSTRPGHQHRLRHAAGRPGLGAAAEILPIHKIAASVASQVNCQKRIR